MKNTSRKPYIYKVTNLETHQYYIGSQCRGKIVGVNYFTSSTNKAFKEGFKNYREEKYKIEVIEEFEDPKECVEIENLMIMNSIQLKDGLCLNRSYCCNGKKVFSTVGTHHTAWNKGIPGWHRGIPWPEEIRQKISTSLKGRPTWNKGIHHTEETRKKISEAHKGTHHSEETRQKLRKAQQGRPSPRRIKISIEGKVFDSIMEASKYYNVDHSTIRYWAKTKKHNAVYIEK